MKIIDVITSRLLLLFPEISGKFPEILNLWKIYKATLQHSSTCPVLTELSTPIRNANFLIQN